MLFAPRSSSSPRRRSDWAGMIQAIAATVTAPHTYPSMKGLVTSVSGAAWINRTTMTTSAVIPHQYAMEVAIDAVSLQRKLQQENTRKAITQGIGGTCIN